MPTKTKVAEVAPEIVIPKNSLQFELLELNSFKGIDKENPVIIDFRNLSPLQNIMVAKGNQGEGKTSLLEGILYFLGAEIDFKQSNLINLKDGTLSGKFQFKKDGRKYLVEANKTTYVVSKQYRDSLDPNAKPEWVEQKSPKTLLRELIGTVITSPMWLKEEKGDKQIEWLYKMLNVPQAVKTKESDLRAKLLTATTSRTQANKEATRIQSVLSEDSFYNNWEVSEKNYKDEKTVDSVKSRLNEVDARRQKYNADQNGLVQMKKTLKDKDRDISELETKITLLKSEKKSLETRITKGEKYIEENKNVILEYENIYKEFEQVSTYNINRGRWMSVIKLKKELDEFQDCVIKLDGQKDDLKQEIKDLLKSILPPIKGLEVETENNIDNKRDIGFYIDGKSPAQLSESELTTFVLQILATSREIGIVAIENLSSFGSDTLTLLNELSSRGFKIFGTLADTSSDELAVVFKESLHLQTTLK